jgi:hypothetical protein
MPSPDMPHEEDIHSRILEYRARAERLTREAAAADPPELHSVYLELARQWAALANHLAERSGKPRAVMSDEPTDKN